MKKTQLLKKQLLYLKEILVWKNFCRTNLSTFEQILAFEQQKNFAFEQKTLCFWTKKTLNLKNLPKRKKKFCT